MTFPAIVAIADLRGIGWKSIEEQMADLEPRDIPEEVQGLEILNPVAFLQSFTHDSSVGHRIPPQRRTPMTFANFTRHLFEPYIVREVTKRFQEAKASMGDFITATQLEWQNEIVTCANRWMKIQQVEYRKLALSDRNDQGTPDSFGVGCSGRVLDRLRQRRQHTYSTSATSRN